MSGETFSFDFTQYCVTDEPLVGQEASSVEINPGIGEQYIGIYNFNPGFTGDIDIISVKTTVDWENPSAYNLSGELLIKARSYENASWITLMSESFDGTNDTSGTVEFARTLTADADSEIYTDIPEVPWYLCASCVLHSGLDEELGDELLADSYFLSGESGPWTLIPSATSYTYLSDDNYVYLRNPVTTPEPTKTGVQSTTFSIFNGTTYKVWLELPVQVEATDDVNYDSRYSRINGYNYYFYVKDANTETVLAGTKILSFTKDDTSYIYYFTAHVDTTAYVEIVFSPSQTYTNNTNVPARIKAELISVKEVTQAENLVAPITCTPNAMIIRCLGETV